MFVNITSEKIKIEEAYKYCQSEACGAQIIFLGNVRNLNEGKMVKGVFYDGNINMAKKVLLQITEEARTKWGDELIIFIEHRIGYLVLTDTSLIIGVATPHRQSAYEVSRFLIEEIKKRLPIWKEEHYVDSDSKWLDGISLNES